MLLTQQTFAKKFGVRQLQQLMSPHFYDLAFLELPQESVYHYLDYDGVTIGPAGDEFLFRNQKHSIPMASVMQLASLEGHPRPTGGNVQALLTDYLHKHRKIKLMRDIRSGGRDKQALVVYNYAPLGRAYKYQQSLYATYYRWRNIFHTAIDNIAHVVEESTHSHFLFVHAPKTIPSFHQMLGAAAELDQTTLKPFRDTNAYILLELWRWLTEQRNASLFELIPHRKLHLVNLVFQESGKWCVLNLGFLNSFRAENGDKNDYALNAKQKLSGIQLAKRLLRLYMSLQELRTLTAKNDVEDADPTEGAGVVVVAPETDDDDDVDVSTKTAPTEVDVDKEATAQALDVLAGLPDLDGHQVLDDMEPEHFQAFLAEQDAKIDEDLKQLEIIVARQAAEAEKAKPTIEAVVLEHSDAPPEQHVIELCDKLADQGAISGGEHRRFERLAQSYKTILAPDGVSTLEQFSVIKPEALKIETLKPMVDSPAVLDKSMLYSSLNEFDSRYIADVMHRDHVNMVLSLQKAGVAVVNYRVEKREDILGAYEEHVLKLAPVVGLPSTLRYKVPVVNADGTFRSNGVSYRLRKQRGDLPIHKIAPDRVALTTYYGKTFVTRGKTQASDYGSWLQAQVMLRILDKTQQDLANPISADVFDADLKSPRNYSAVSKVLKGCYVIPGEGTGSFMLNFDHGEVLSLLPAEVVNFFEKKGSLILGWNPIKSIDRWAYTYLVIDRLGNVTKQRASGGVLVEHEDLGSLEDLLHIDTKDSPIEYTSVNVYGKSIPVGIVLGLEMGLHNLLDLLRLTPRIVPAGTRLNLQPDEWALSFSDESLIFKRENRLAALILGGFNEYWRTLKSFSVYSFDQRGVYVNLLEANGLGAKFVREIDLMYQMFVDPISLEILQEMKEPVTFKGLLFRATQMLLIDQHPDELDPAHMRIKGYERIPGAVYNQLIQSLRAHNGKLGKRSAQIEQKPYALWKQIVEDPAKMQVQEINPLKAIKEAEAATFAGDGGRNKRSMTKHTRAFHPNDMGTISESTVDSSDVGINIYTSSNPKFTSLRGMSERMDFKKDGPTSLLSTSANLAPASDHDDPKRVNFIAIQQEHAIAAKGYHQFTVRTGYDSIVAQRTTELFAVVAKQPGVVRSVAPTGLIVDYADGSAQGYTLGSRFGNAAGLTIEHHVVTPLKEGEAFTVGDPICYNDGFFEPDFFNPKQIVFKNALNVTTVLWESVDTHEDSSAISKRVSELLTARITKVKTIAVKFDQAVAQLVKVGDHVTADSVLCLIEDAVTANNKLFDAASIETLKAVSAQSPRAKAKGVVQRVEIFYHGDKEDMSETLLELANAGDRELKKRAMSTGAPVFTGKVDGGFRIDNNPLPVDSLAIRIYISSDVASGVGDKGVFANQMKTVHGRVIEEAIITEDGTRIDAIFGMKSIEARIVESPIIIGTTNTLLRVGAKRMVDLYRGRAKP